MNTVKLRIAIGNYPHTLPLKDGRVRVEGVELEFIEHASILTAARSMVRNLDYDVVEMPLTTFIVARNCGKPLTALPVFPVRVLPHFLMFANSDVVRKPSDIRGRTVGVRAYTVTTGVWGRGVLARDYGIKSGDVTWATADDEHVLEFRRPPNVKPAPAGGLGELLNSGEIAAVVGVDLDLTKFDRVVPLIKDPAEAAQSWLDAGYPYPLNHTITVKSEVLEQHPGLASAMFAAFEQAKLAAADAGTAIVDATGNTRQTERQFAQSIIGEHPIFYGLEANRGALDVLAEMLIEQHIAAPGLAVGPMFADI